MGLTRRQYLSGAVSVSFGTLAATAPTAHEQASLGATVRVQSDAVDETGDIGHLWMTIRNDRPADGESIDPVVQCWAMERQTQLAWTIQRGEIPISPGAEQTLYLTAPGDRQNARLPAGNKGMARVWDRGTDQSAHDIWVVDAI